MELPPGIDPAMAGLGRRISQDILEPMKRAFIGKDEIIDLLGVCLVAGENLFILGPPGTAKSALVRDLCRRLDGRVFDYLLTRFTEPNELFGPFDIRKLRDGELITNTEGMLPEASLAFLDELLNANSAILNSLLMALNERVFRRGRETRQLPLLMVVGASNRLPEDEALGALFDRFLLRVRCDNVAEDQLGDVIRAGWDLEMGVRHENENGAKLGVEDVRGVNRLLAVMDFRDIREPYRQFVIKARTAGIAISDRRAVKLQRLAAASALLCGRLHVELSDLWVLRHIWDRNEQREVLAALVDSTIASAELTDKTHVQARKGNQPDPEALARDLEQIRTAASAPDVTRADLASLRDRLTLVAGRVQWVPAEITRAALETQISELRERFSNLL